MFQATVAYAIGRSKLDIGARVHLNGSAVASIMGSLTMLTGLFLVGMQQWIRLRRRGEEVQQPQHSPAGSVQLPTEGQQIESHLKPGVQASAGGLKVRFTSTFGGILILVIGALLVTVSAITER